MMKTLKRTMVVLGVLLFTAGHAEESQKAMALSIKAPQMIGALIEFTQQTGLQLIFSTQDAENIPAPQLDGRYTPRAALEVLLKNSGLQYEFINEQTVTIAPNGKRSNSVSQIPPLSTDSIIRMAQADTSSADSNSSAARQGSEEKQNTSAESSEGTKLDEIIVTATKRAERLQDIALSISAIGKDELERRGIQEMSDVLRSIPGVVNFDNDSFNNAIAIRGIIQSVYYQNTGAGPTTSIYFDETPITFAGGRVGAIDIKFADIERFEVLRGPQGTTFGDASLSGAVRIIPVAPKFDKLEGNVAGNYSVTGGYGGGNSRVEGMLNLPLVTDKLAIRASLYRHENTGFVKGVAGSDPAAVALHTAFGSAAYAVDRDHQGSNRFLGGRIAALWSPTENLQIELSYLRQETEQDGLTNSSVAPYQNTNTDSFPAQRTRDYAGEFSDSQIDLAGMKVKYDFGWADLLSSVSYVDSGVQWVWAQYYKFALPWDVGGIVRFDSLTTEVRLASKLQGPWQFLTGLYYEKLNSFEYEDAYHLGTPATNFYYADPLIYTLTEDEQKSQKSVFGELSYDLTQKLKLTGGGRYYQYDRSNLVTLGGGIHGFPAPDANDGGNTYSTDDSGVTFKADLSYRPNRDSLIYALWSQGFRLGRAQAGLIAALCDQDGDGFIDDSAGLSNVPIASTRSLESDSLENYELGGKFTLLDGRMTVDADVFRDEWTKVPQRHYFNLSRPGGCGVDINVGEAVSTGIEFQVSARVTRALRVDLGAAYINAEYSKDSPGIGVFDGDRLPNSPRFNGNLSFQFDVDVLSNPSYLRADSSYTGSFPDNNAPAMWAGGYFMLDATIGTSFGGFDAALFVNNVTDTRKIAIADFGGPRAGIYTRPRTIGLKLKYSF